jgi:uncharacterized protein (DUF58 family)
VRLRKRAAGLTFGGGVLFLLGTNVQAGWLFVICALLLGAVIAGILMPSLAVRGLDAELVAPEEAEQAGEAFVELRLINRARGVRWSLVVSDQHLSPTEVLAPSIRPGEAVELTTLRSPLRRGLIETTGVTVRAAAPFGVAERRRTLTVHASTLVLPRVFELGPLPFVESIGTVEHAMHSVPRRGGGPEYLGIREYRPGDSMRHVHWPSTARHGAVMVREFEEERTRRVAIVVDTERDEGEAWTPLDRCCSAAASIASAAFAHGHGARLAAASPDGHVDVLARAEEREVLRWLGSLDPTGVPVATVAQRLGLADLRGAETVVLVAAAWEGTDLSAAVGRLAASVPRVVLVVVGTGSDRDRRDDALDAVAARSAASGVETYAWPVGSELSDVLEAAR